MNKLGIRPHDVGYGIFLIVWAVLPFFVIREPMTAWKRAAVAVWYLGVSLGVAVYLVTR